MTNVLGGPVAICTLEWHTEPVPGLRLLDQTRLPHEEAYIHATTTDLLIDAIQRLAVRGAPALGAVGAYGVAVVQCQAERDGWSPERIQKEIDRLRDARPTAANLAWGVERVRSLLNAGVESVLGEAHRIVREDKAANRRLSKLGADWINERVANDKVRVLTHCNTGSLATTEWGTALGLVRDLHVRECLGLVYVNESRPLLQGSRLTTWELQREGIDHVVQVDSAAASTIMRGLIDVAVIGADRIVANGDTANKIGSVGIALACAEAGVPFVVAAPWSTVDVRTADGSQVTIEERAPEEVTQFNGIQSAPPQIRAYNPAFDITPRRLIDAIVTERGVVEPKLHPRADLFSGAADG